MYKLFKNVKSTKFNALENVYLYGRTYARVANFIRNRKNSDLSGCDHGVTHWWQILDLFIGFCQNSLCLLGHIIWLTWKGEGSRGYELRKGSRKIIREVKGGKVGRGIIVTRRRYH